LVLKRQRHAVEGRPKADRILQERRDVVEEDARLREIGDVPDAPLQVVHVEPGHRMLNPVVRHVGGASSTRMSVTCACGGPCPIFRSNRSTASASPSAKISTRPSGRFRTHPCSPSRAAASSAKNRKPTPWTRPLITYRRAIRMQRTLDYTAAERPALPRARCAAPGDGGSTDGAPRRAARPSPITRHCPVTTTNLASAGRARHSVRPDVAHNPARSYTTRSGAPRALNSSYAGASIVQ